MSEREDLGCVLCLGAIMPDEKRTLFRGRLVHYDCLVEWELDEEGREPPSGFKDSRGVEY